MATRTRSHTGESSETFSQQNVLKNPEKEIYAFDNADIEALRASVPFLIRRSSGRSTGQSDQRYHPENGSVFRHTPFL
ncbi:hypothetical protein Hanom_Chr16g01491561 [Helianthus anomalus]